MKKRIATPLFADRGIVAARLAERRGLFLARAGQRRELEGLAEGGHQAGLFRAGQLRRRARPVEWRMLQVGRRRRGSARALAGDQWGGGAHRGAGDHRRFGADRPLGGLRAEEGRHRGAGGRVVGAGGRPGADGDLSGWGNRRRAHGRIFRAQPGLHPAQGAEAEADRRCGPFDGAARRQHLSLPGRRRPRHLPGRHFQRRGAGGVPALEQQGLETVYRAARKPLFGQAAAGRPGRADQGQLQGLGRGRPAAA